MKPLKVFIGYDPRQPVAYNVCAHSVQRHASVPVTVCMLKLDQLPITRRGLTEFTFSRFLVPWLCDYEGWAVFMDADIIMRGDIAKLFNCAQDKYQIQVMQYQAKFEWASVMLFNNAQCQVLTPEYIEDENHNPLSLSWATNVGNFPRKFNHCVGYEKSPEIAAQAELFHYTKGIPVWKETSGNPEDKHWLKEAKLSISTCSYQELMGGSVHAAAANQ